MIRFLTYLLMLVMLLGCNIPTSPQETTPAPLPTNTVAVTATNTPSIPTPEAQITTLRIWVPPQFDPSAETPAAELFNARLKEFALRRPETKIEVRVKALEGQGGILDSLITSNAAAPLAVPDLVIMPREMMETAAIKGLLHPFDGLTTTMEDADWYGYARQLALLQNSTFGIPFAGDALILVYRPDIIDEPPASWADALNNPAPIAFAASDPQALLTLTYYQASGGILLDDSERPMLDPAQLTPIFTYYQQAVTAGLLPFWITQYETNEQAWEAFEQKQTNMVITWLSRYLENPPADAALAQIPSSDGAPITTATGWVWVLSSPDSNKHEITTQLAEFLTTSDFLAKWTTAANSPPTRPSSLENWGDPSVKTLISEILPSAKLIPPQDILNTVGPVIRDATISILKDKIDPEIAAQTASDTLKNP